jgi:hypothetical protein
LLPRAPAGLGFRRWLDTQSIPFPGDPDRRCDTVAELIDADGLRPPWAIIVELSTRPDPDLTDRLLEYLARLRRELRHGPHGRDRYLLGAVVVYLTGSPPDPSLDMALPGQDDVALSWRVRPVPMAREDAVAMLAGIEDNRVSRALLPWVPLMRGGGEPDAILTWKRLAEAEPSAEHSRILGALAATFAEAAERGPAWRQALEGWNVEEGPWLREMRIAAELKGRRESLLRVLQVRFTRDVPGPMLERIRTQSDTDELQRWFDLALTSPSLADFRAAVGI